MKSTAVSKGEKPYFQADVKVYLVASSSGRYGFKLSYNRGSLPPVYSRVPSFQFRFVVRGGALIGKSAHLAAQATGW